MTYIKIISKRNATGAAAEAYAAVENVTGAARVPHIMKAFSLRGETMGNMVRMWELGMWMGEAPRKEREFLAATVSRLNACDY